jgi:hypothetical protein
MTDILRFGEKINPQDKIIKRKQCPIPQMVECIQSDCAWWCGGENECSVKVIALEFITRNT